MDSSSELIKKVSTPRYGEVVIETNNKRYFAKLERFKKVFCYPEETEWPKVSIDSRGLDLIWPSRFELHIDQIIDHAYKTEIIKEAC